jgi:ribonuclease HI
MPDSLTPSRKADLLRSLADGETVEHLVRAGAATAGEFRALFLEASSLFPGQCEATPWRIFIDGASRNNPGLSAAGVVLKGPGGDPRWEEGTFLGMGTNNEAEYRALLLALEKARALGARSLLVHSDSELLVRQMTGRYRVKEPRLQRLHHEAGALARHFEQVSYRHVPREQNRRADELANQALDEYIKKQR